MKVIPFGNRVSLRLIVLGIMQYRVQIL